MTDVAFSTYASTLTATLTWGCTQQISPTASSTNKGLSVTQSASGTDNSTYGLNQINITSDNMATGGLMNNGFLVFHHYGGSAINGGRQGAAVYTYLESPTNATNTNRNYVAVYAASRAVSGDGGTSTTPGSGAKGAIFGINPTGIAEGGATNLLEVSGGEVNIACQTGCSVGYKALWTLVARSDDKVQGAVYDTMLSCSNQTGAVGFNDGILFGAMNGAWPLTSGATIMRTMNSSTVTNGIDLSNTTFTGSAFKSNLFSISPTGAVQGASFAMNAGPKLLSAAGSPEGVVTAVVGSIYMRTNGAAGSSMYVKETGGGNTGWVAK